MADKEIWKDIEGYEGLYQVSNMGRVRSFKNNGGNLCNKPRILVPVKDRKGYLRIGLRKNSKAKTWKIHRLVANAFITNALNKPQVNHINGIKTDNRAENLEWVTQSQNIQHAYKTGLNVPISGAGARKLSSEQIKQIVKLYKPFNEKFSQRALAQKFGVCEDTIRAILKHEKIKVIKKEPKHLSDSEIAEIKKDYIPYHKEYGASALGRKLNVCPSTILKYVNN